MNNDVTMNTTTQDEGVKMNDEAPQFTLEMINEAAQGEALGGTDGVSVSREQVELSAQMVKAIDPAEARRISLKWFGDDRHWHIAMFANKETASRFMEDLLRTEQEEAQQRWAWKEKAINLGREAAVSAAGWCCDGNTTVDHADRVLKMMSDGDPEVYDYLPQPPSLSGEMADSMTALDLFKEVVGREMRWAVREDQEWDLALQDELADAWEEGAQEMFEDACTENLRKIVEDDEPDLDDVRWDVEDSYPGKDYADGPDVFMDYRDAVDRVKWIAVRLAELGWYIEEGVASRDNTYAIKATRRGMERSVQTVRVDYADLDVDGEDEGLSICGAPGHGYFEPAIGCRDCRSEVLEWGHGIKRGEKVFVVPVGSEPGDEHCWKAEVVGVGSGGWIVVSVREGATHQQTVKRIYRVNV